MAVGVLFTGFPVGILDSKAGWCFRLNILSQVCKYSSLFIADEVRLGEQANCSHSSPSSHFLLQTQ